MLVVETDDQGELTRARLTRFARSVRERFGRTKFTRVRRFLLEHSTENENDRDEIRTG